MQSLWVDLEAEARSSCVHAMALEFQSHGECQQLTSTVAQVGLAGDIAQKTRVYGQGDTIWRIGAVPDRVYRLRTGRVDIVSVDSAGNELLLRVVRPGETFGEICFCGHRSEPHNFVARAAAHSEIGETAYTEFSKSMRRDPQLMESVLREFCVRLGDLEERARILALHDATERLCKLLAYLARLRGVRSQSGSNDFSLTISHSELAAMSALTRPHVSLLMTQLRKRGWVSYGRGTPLKVHLDKVGAE